MFDLNVEENIFLLIFLKRHNILQMSREHGKFPFSSILSPISTNLCYFLVSFDWGMNGHRFPMTDSYYAVHIQIFLTKYLAKVEAIKMNIIIL